MKRLIVIALLALVVAGCKKTPTGETTYHGAFEVSHLFTHDGCKVYRFYDEGRYRYYANCPSNTSVQHGGSCGKNCTYDDNISTSY